MGYTCDHCGEELHRDSNGYFVGKDETSDCSMTAAGHRYNGKESLSRIAIIAEADKRWPADSYDYIAAYNLSGGFIDGAMHVIHNPRDDRDPEDIAKELYTFSEDTSAAAEVGTQRRNGARLGVEWIREQVKS